jgi:2-octaprenyl-6-methoxyphenol hydroxylase
MKKQTCDVLIIGGGIVGLSLAKGLEQLGVSYLLVDESLSKPATGIRPLALSKTSIAILKYLNIWSHVQSKTTDIRNIHVSIESAFGYLLLNEEQLEHLGVVIDLNELQAALHQELQEKKSLMNGRFLNFDAKTQSVRIQKDESVGEIQAQIIIAADGALSSVRKDCGLPLELETEQEAIIGMLTLKHPHEGKAFERFTNIGPLALLPWHTHDMAIVWSLSKDKVQELRKNHFSSFKQLIEKQLAHRMGDVLSIGSVRTYPLRQIFMPVQSYQNILFLGNAAHTLHPVAGQGFNLSLRDVVTFLAVLQEYGISSETFPIYLLRRKKDQEFTLRLTHFLAGGFNHLPGFMKGMGLLALSNHLGLRQTFANYAQGLGYPLPEQIYHFLEEANE